jgi:hypothetical protein
VGLNGTVVSLPQAEQLVVVSTRSLATGPAAGRDARFALQLLHRLGSFLKFLSAKKSCSPAVHMNSVPQSTQCSDLSWNSIGPTSHNHLSAHAPAKWPARIRDRDDPIRTNPLTLLMRLRLLRLATLLLSRTLSSERLLGPAPIAWLQIEGMFLDILDDIFLLNFPFEPAERALDRFAFLNLDFSQP